jgi:hypothetical protein
VQERDQRDPRAAQRRQRGCDEQRQAPVGVGEDRVVQQHRLRRVCLSGQSARPRADLRARRADALPLGAIEPMHRARHVLPAQRGGEQGGVVAYAAGRARRCADHCHVHGLSRRRGLGRCGHAVSRPGHSPRGSRGRAPCIRSGRSPRA